MEKKCPTCGKPFRKEEILSMDLSDLDFSVRTYNLLKNIDAKLFYSNLGPRLQTVGDLIQFSWQQLFSQKGMGRKSLNEIIYKLNDLGFKLQDKPLKPPPPSESSPAVHSVRPSQSIL